MSLGGFPPAAAQSKKQTRLGDGSVSLIGYVGSLRLRLFRGTPDNEQGIAHAERKAVRGTSIFIDYVISKSVIGTEPPVSISSMFHSHCE